MFVHWVKQRGFKIKKYLHCVCVLEGGVQAYQEGTVWREKDKL